MAASRHGTFQATRTGRQGWPLLALALLCLAGMVGAPLPRCEKVGVAATIQKVQKDKTRIIVSLSQSELAMLEEDAQLVVEYAGVSYSAVARVVGINVPKKTAILAFEEAQPNVQKRQSLHFVSTMWNARTSPLLQTLGQYHQFSRSDVEASFGLFNQVRHKTLRAPDTEPVATTSTTDGHALRLSSYVLFDPRWFGATVGYEYQAADVKVEGDGERNEVNELVVTRLVPAMWVGVSESLRLSLRTDIVTSQRKRNGSFGRSTLNHDLSEYRIGLVHYGSHHEMGFEYKDKAEFTATDAKPRLGNAGAQTSVKDRLRLPAELSIFGRKVLSPDFIWGAALAYVFYQRNEVEGGPLASQPKAYEMIKFHTGFEHRLGTGDKFDWILHYAGARTVDDLLQQRLSNLGGVTFSYQSKMGEGFTGGALLRGEAGSRIEENTFPDGSSLDAKDAKTLQHTSHRAYAYWLQVFARYEFDSLPSRERRS